MAACAADRSMYRLSTASKAEEVAGSFSRALDVPCSIMLSSYILMIEQSSFSGKRGPTAVDARENCDNRAAVSARKFNGRHAHFHSQRTEQRVARSAVGVRWQDIGLDFIEGTEQVRWKETQKFFRVNKRNPLHIEGTEHGNSDVRLKP